MEIRDRWKSPPGGWSFLVEVDGSVQSITTPVSFSELVRLVAAFYANNKLENPESFERLVEEQICSRLPEDNNYCWGTSGIGDKTARLIHAVARGADNVSRRLGIRKDKETLEKKAKGCSGCQRRRQKMNEAEDALKKLLGK